MEETSVVSPVSSSLRSQSVRVDDVLDERVEGRLQLGIVMAKHSKLLI